VNPQATTAEAQHEAPIEELQPTSDSPGLGDELMRVASVQGVAPAGVPPPDPRLLLALQRTAGNAATAHAAGHLRALPGLHKGTARPAATRRAVTSEPVVQREGGQVDESAALIQAIQLVNKNSLAKVKLPIKAAPGTKLFGALELKKLELELDIVGELRSPELSGKGGPKVSVGPQNVTTKETNAADGKRQEARAAVLALELEQKFGSSPFEEMFSWKAGAEYGSYTPTDALTPNKREFKGKLGLKIAAEGWALEFEFTPIAYDATKKGADAWKILTTTIKVSKEFSVGSLPKILNVGGATVDATLKVKVTGSADIGPDYAAAASILGKLLPKENIIAFLTSAAPAIAKEESDKFLERLIKEMVADRTKEIADPGIRVLVEREARKRLAEEVATREAAIKLAEECSIFVRREMVAKAESEVSIVAISSAADDVVRKTAQEFLTGAPQATLLREAVGAALKQTIKEISLKKAASKVAQSLIPGPADFVLVGVEILYNYVDTVLKDMDMKELGLRTLAVRDNYVAGYEGGLKGNGPKTGAATGAPAGGGNFEGAAQMLGLGEGGKMFDQVMSTMGDQTGGTPDELRPYVVEEMANLPVNRGEVIAKAAPELKKMMMEGIERKYSGGVLRFLFGRDFKGTKDYEYFEQMIDSFLKEGAGNTTVANLANGVKVTLVMLDSTSDRAQKFRTMDGRFTNVTIGGDTDQYSGWITEDGTPLEQIYKSQEAADESASEEGDKERIEAHKRALASASLSIDGTYNVIAFTTKAASLSGAPGDLEFMEFLRSPEFQGMTISSSGVKASIEGSCTFSEGFVEGLDEDVTVDFEGTVKGNTASVVVDHDSDHPELTEGGWASDLAATLLRDVGGKRFAAMPKLG
jgi:hypothetical protein